MQSSAVKSEKIRFWREVVLLTAGIFSLLPKLFELLKPIQDYAFGFGVGIISYWTLGIFQKMAKRREDNAGQTAAIAVKPIVAQATTELNIAISQGTNETVKVWWDTFSIPLGDFLGSPRNEQTSYILFTLAKIFKHLETKTESSNLIASACRSRGLLP